MTDQTPNDPQDASIDDAYEHLAIDAAYIQTPETPGRDRRPLWVISAIAAACLAVFVGVVAMVAQDDDDPNDESSIVANPSSEKPTQEPTKTDPAVTSTILPDEVLVPSGDDDLYYPWVYPLPYMAYYEEGCPSPEEVLKGFMSNIIGDNDPSYTTLGGREPYVVYVVYAKGEGGTLLYRGTHVTVVTLVPIDPTVVDCDAYGVLQAESVNYQVYGTDHVLVETPAADRIVGARFDVTGFVRSFQVDLAVLDDSYQPVAANQGLSNAPTQTETGLAPFAETVTLTTAPIDANLIVLAHASNPADGAIEPFAVRKVRFDGSEIN
jgi:hypothetical protein